MRAFVQVRAKRDAQVHRTGLTWVDHTSEAYSIAQTIALVRRLLDGMASCTLRGCVLCTAWLFCTVLFHALSRMSYGICCALSAARCTKLVARWRLGPWGACEKCHFAARLLHAAVCTRMFTVLFLTITHRRAHFHPHAVTPSESIRAHCRASLCCRCSARACCLEFMVGPMRQPSRHLSLSIPPTPAIPTRRRTQCRSHPARCLLRDLAGLTAVCGRCSAQAAASRTLYLRSRARTLRLQSETVTRHG